MRSTVNLNSCMKCRTRPLWTRPCRAKPRRLLPDRHVRSVPFYDIMQHRMIIP